MERLAAVNLNLLVSLDALLTEGGVSLAAQRLGVTQSAMSHTLRQLRELFEDPLLVRAGRRMVPTPRATALAPDLRAALATLDDVVGHRGVFEPERFSGRFSLATQDGVSAMLGTSLIRRVRAEAPRAELSLVRPPEDLAVALEDGRIDIATAPPIDVPAGLCQVDIGVTTTWSVLCWEDHPVTELDLDAYCALPHVMMSLSGKGPGLVDHILARHGRARWVALRAPWMLSMPFLLVGTDLIATVPTPAADHFIATEPLRKMTPPMPIPGPPMILLWHARYQSDPAHTWFREAVRESFISAAQ